MRMVLAICLGAALFAPPASAQTQPDAAFSARCAAISMRAAMAQPVDTQEWTRLHERNRYWEARAESADPEQARVLYYAAYDRVPDEAYARIPADTRGDQVVVLFGRALQDMVAECDSTLNVGNANG